jgi:asparagine synthase (glutamine-hydrolysing)
MDIQHDYPLASMARANKWRPSYQGETLYRESFEKLATYLQERGVGVIFQGHGGDELFDNIPQYEQGDIETPVYHKDFVMPSYATPAFHTFATKAIASTPPATVSLLSHTAAVGGVGANNAYIDHDIWPVKPLADPRLYLYCQSLPIQYRMDRNIMRAYLHARGFPEIIYQPGEESFDSFFAEATIFGQTDTFTELMQHSVLAKKGYIDPALALDTWRAICANPAKAEAADELFGLYCLLLAEINLRAIS